MEYSWVGAVILWYYHRDCLSQILNYLFTHVPKEKGLVTLLS